MTRIAQDTWQAAAQTMTAPIDAFLNAATSGILPDTRVASAFGWRPVQALVPGDLVLTFDHGMQPLVEVRHHLVQAGTAPRDVASWPLRVSPGVLGNKAPLLLLPGQVILVESDLAEDLLGDPFVAIEARALGGLDGVTRDRPPARFIAVTLHFEADQAIFGAGGMMIVCAGNGDMLTDRGGQAAYPVLGTDAARTILAGGVLPAGAAA